jgi:hypothetical protein
MQASSTTTHRQAKSGLDTGKIVAQSVRQLCAPEIKQPELVCCLGIRIVSRAIKSWQYYYTDCLTSQGKRHTDASCVIAKTAGGGDPVAVSVPPELVG